jgi:hypothetical protein
MGITIILQGITCPDIDIIKTLTEYTKLARVILSIYLSVESPDLIEKIRVEFPSILIIDNEQSELEKLCIQKFGNVPQANKHTFFQLNCMKKALCHVRDQYVIKSRVDHYYGSLDKFIEKLYTNKIVSSSNCIRGVRSKYGKYHLSDSLFGGLTVQIKRVYNLAILSNKLLDIPEIILWKPYLTTKFNELKLRNNSELEYSNSMCQLVTVYSIYNTVFKIRLNSCKRVEARIPINYNPSYKTFTTIYTNIYTTLEYNTKNDVDYFLNGITCGF